MDFGGGGDKGLSLRAEDPRSSWTMSNGESEDRDQANGEKRCADCRTTKTPLWRAGPSGPKSLCNACGIRYRKKMVSVMRVSKGTEKSKRETTQTHANVDGDNKATISPNTTKTGESLKVKLNLMALVKKHRCWRTRKLAEEEEAAVLLMALSCGSVFA